MAENQPKKLYLCPECSSKDLNVPAMTDLNTRQLVEDPCQVHQVFCPICQTELETHVCEVDADKRPKVCLTCGKNHTQMVEQHYNALVAHEGWNENTQFQLLFNFVEENHDWAAFLRFAKDWMAEEDPNDSTRMESCESCDELFLQSDLLVAPDGLKVCSKCADEMKEQDDARQHPAG